MSRWLAIALLTLGLANTAAATDSKTNLQIFHDVSSTVQRYAFFTVFDSVNISIDRGVVTLTGKVTMPYKAEAIGERVARVSGVTGVRNKLEVLPVSQFDDGLRLAAVRAVFRNPSLARYGLGANPSIHVIVDRGHLTLDGTVNNDMDRQIAESAVSMLSAFSVTNNLKTDEEVARDLERL